MTQANELRIGNWINSKLLGSNHKVTGLLPDILYTDLQLSYSKYEDWQPIFLTPGILEKIGFKRIDHIHGYSFYSLSQSKKNRCHIDIYPEKTSWMSYSVKHCKYVYELQNLFYSLTGDELEIVW